MTDPADHGDRPITGTPHHVEIWVPDLARAEREWGWRPVISDNSKKSPVRQPPAFDMRDNSMKGPILTEPCISTETKCAPAALRFR